MPCVCLYLCFQMPEMVYPFCESDVRISRGYFLSCRVAVKSTTVSALELIALRSNPPETTRFDEHVMSPVDSSFPREGSRS